MQGFGLLVPYIAPGLFIFFIFFFCGGPGMYSTQLGFSETGNTRVASFSIVSYRFFSMY